MLRLTCDLSASQAEVDAMLGDARDVWSIYEARAVLSSDHDPVEDIFFFDGEDSLHLPNSPSIAVITSSPDCQGFIGNRRARIFVHNRQVIWSNGPLSARRYPPYLRRAQLSQVPEAIGESCVQEATL
jgi:hypothetical protein